MSETNKNQEDKKISGRDWSTTLFLPKTDFPMRAGLPELEPKLVKYWEDIDLYKSIRQQSAGKPKFILHDGPPYANGNIHIGHALNKILKDIVIKSQQMMGFDSCFIPGWDCHGLPIEWKIEEEYRTKNQNKDQIPINEFRKQCREFANKWLNVQRTEFKSLGVIGDWSKPYSTMEFRAEATIAVELMKFAQNGLLYRGSKPVMWSVVEKTALAEAEIEYQDHQSDMIWVKFPVSSAKILLPQNTSVVIWTTTPWTIPGNRAISYSSLIKYGIYLVEASPEGNWAKAGDVYLLAEKLASEVMKAAKVEKFKRLDDTRDDLQNNLNQILCAHPLASLGYNFVVPLLEGDHVTDDTGTGFVHTAPGHGADDYNIWKRYQTILNERGIDTSIPFTVDENGVLTDAAPGFSGRTVLKQNGDKGDANETVIKSLMETGNIVARGRLKHQYPHSWRSKKPLIFRNTPQWFISMDRPFSIPSKVFFDRTSALFRSGPATLRAIALKEIDRVLWVPEAGRNRINGMVESRPDWVVSRQRAWGVPITVFRNPQTEEILPSPHWPHSAELISRIEKAFCEKGADVWFEPESKYFFLKGLLPGSEIPNFEQVRDVLDVWFDSGSTHAFTLDDPKTFPSFDRISRASLSKEGRDYIMYLEGSDQHRGWFQSSLLESCGTRGCAPYDIVLTHGFVLDEKGQKMSKSLGNVVSPQNIMQKSGADILRLWVAASDYSDDLRIGPEILKTFSESYRKLRNTLRWMLGALSHYKKDEAVSLEILSQFELERLILHWLVELNRDVQEAYNRYDYRKVVALLSHFMNTQLSAFYFDIRKDTLYCEAPSSLKRKAALTVVDHLLNAILKWLAPILSFTCEEAWSHYTWKEAPSIHLMSFPTLPDQWYDPNLAAKWQHVRRVRRSVTAALEIERAEKRIGSSLEAAPTVFVEDKKVFNSLDGIDMAEICITSAIEIFNTSPPKQAFVSPEESGVGVVPKRAEGKKCARSWRITKDVGSDPVYPDLSARDAGAMRELDQHMHI